MTFRLDDDAYAAYRTAAAAVRARVDGAATGAAARLAPDDLGRAFAALTAALDAGLERVRRDIARHARTLHADADALDEVIAALRAREAENGRGIRGAGNDPWPGPP